MKITGFLLWGSLAILISFFTACGSEDAKLIAPKACKVIKVYQAPSSANKQADLKLAITSYKAAAQSIDQLTIIGEMRSLCPELHPDNDMFNRILSEMSLLSH